MARSKTDLRILIAAVAIAAVAEGLSGCGSNTSLHSKSASLTVSSANAATLTILDMATSMSDASSNTHQINYVVQVGSTPATIETWASYSSASSGSSSTQSTGSQTVGGTYVSIDSACANLACDQVVALVSEGTGGSVGKSQAIGLYGVSSDSAETVSLLDVLQNTSSTSAINASPVIIADCQSKPSCASALATYN